MRLWGDVAGDEHHGRGVHIRRRDAGGEVCCAGAGRGEAHADLSGAAGIAVGRVGRALLVGCEDVGDFVVVIVERVVHVQDRSAGIAEYGIHGPARADTRVGFVRRSFSYLSVLLLWL